MLNLFHYFDFILGDDGVTADPRIHHLIQLRVL